MKLHDFIIHPKTGRLHSSAARSQVVDRTEASGYYDKMRLASGIPGLYNRKAFDKDMFCKFHLVLINVSK